MTDNKDMDEKMELFSNDIRKLDEKYSDYFDTSSHDIGQGRDSIMAHCRIASDYDAVNKKVRTILEFIPALPDTMQEEIRMVFQRIFY